MEDLERIYQLISKEEKKVLANLENIDKELQELGTEQKSIVIKTIKGKKYYYEQWRENGVIKYRSFGRVYPGAVCQTEKQISRRKELLDLQKEQRLLSQQLFAKENMTRYQLNKILEMRCFEKERGDIRQILEHLGLKEYNPQEIVKRTHGVSYNDYIWFRFPGEKLAAKDVLGR